MLGLFLLGLVRPRAGSRSALAGVGAGIAVILSVTFSPSWSGSFAGLRSPFHKLLILVFRTAAIVVGGTVAAWLTRWRKAEDSGR
jgi:Na+/proline symporter